MARPPFALAIAAVLAAVLAITLLPHAALGRPAPASLCPPVPAAVVTSFAAPPCPWCPGNRGLEYGTGPGATVRAAGAGRVTFAGPVARSVWLTIEHADGLRTSYGPLQRLLVTAGAIVARGQPVGTTAGRLHLGARRGATYVDPAPLLTCRDLRARLIPDHRPRTAVGRLQAVPTSATGSFWTDVLARLPAKSCPPCGGVHRWHHFRRTCAHGSMAVDALDRSLRCPSGLIALWAHRVT